MRKILAVGCLLLASTGARAADVYPQVDAPMWNWTGIYVGLAAGGGFEDSEFNVKDEDCKYLNGLCAVAHNPDGLAAGGQITGLWQFANTPFVIGAEAQGLFSDFQDNQDVIFGLVKTESHTNSLFMAKGQLGYAFDRAYVYGTGGWAWADHEVRADIPILDAHWSDNQFIDGFVFGAGAKFVVVDGTATQSPSVVFGLEWNRLELNGDFANTVKFGGLGGGYAQELQCCYAPKLKIESDHNIDVVTGSVSIKF